LRVRVPPRVLIRFHGFCAGAGAGGLSSGRELCSILSRATVERSGFEEPRAPTYKTLKLGVEEAGRET
jgi:hypothetical protein